MTKEKLGFQKADVWKDKERVQSSSQTSFSSIWFVTVKFKYREFKCDAYHEGKLESVNLFLVESITEI